ncbi:hypothetical protein E1301_Tti013213 [Triplophysa tibetana]|uniref:Uncharacterized protein n=1 Tax=Triplophysa tibetana TaxID=1572043 RepID=A0A5A9NIW4_9TELE|nr:hypothetical protein E1301_Tti013213 [Triplophysa tibetana]
MASLLKTHIRYNCINNSAGGFVDERLRTTAYRNQRAVSQECEAVDHRPGARASARIWAVNLTLCTVVSVNTAVRTSGAPNDVIGLGV